MPHVNRKGVTPPEHKPTGDSIVLVENLVQAGVTHSQIAQVLDIGLETLRKHYGTVLKKAKLDLMAKVTRRFKHHMFDDEVPPAVSLKACEIYANSQMGWKQQQTVEQHTTVAVDEQTLEQMKGLSITDLINVGKGLDQA